MLEDKRISYLKQVLENGMTRERYDRGKSLGVFTDSVFEHVSTEAFNQDILGQEALQVATENVFANTKDRIVKVFSFTKEKIANVKAFIDKIRTPDYADTARICTHTQVTQAIDALERSAALLNSCQYLVKQQMMGSENGHKKIVDLLISGVENLKWPFGEFDVSEGQDGEVSITKGTARISAFSELAAEYPKPLKELGWTPDTLEQTRERFFRVAETVNKAWGAFSKALVDVNIDTDAVDGQRIQASYGSLVALDSFMKMITSATTDLIRETFSRVYKRAQTYAKKA